MIRTRIPSRKPDSKRFISAPTQVPVELFIALAVSKIGRLAYSQPGLYFLKAGILCGVKPTEIEIDGIGRIKANWMLTRKGTSQRLVLYWYQHRELSFGSEIDYRLELFKRNILGGCTDSTVIATPIRDHGNVEQAQDRLKSVASKVYPKLALA